MIVIENSKINHVMRKIVIRRYIQRTNEADSAESISRLFNDMFIINAFSSQEVLSEYMNALLSNPVLPVLFTNEKEADIIASCMVGAIKTLIDNLDHDVDHGIELVLKDVVAWLDSNYSEVIPNYVKDHLRKRAKR